MAWLMIFNRKAAGSASGLAMQWLLAMVAAPLLVAAAGLLHLTGARQFEISMPDGMVALKCLAVAVFATLGHWLIYSATVRASAAVVAPMTYVQLMVAMALGWALFGHPPDPVTLGGATLIVAGGLLLWRSQKPPLVAETPD